MRPSATRVAARHLALVVPPRREREVAMYRAFLKGLRKPISRFDQASKILDNESVVELLWGAGMESVQPPLWKPSKVVDGVESSLGDLRDVPLAEMTRESYDELLKTRNYVRWQLEDAVRDSSRWSRWLDELDEAVNSRDFKSDLAYTEDVTDRDVGAIRETVSAGREILDAIQMLLKRMARIGESSGSDAIPATAEVGRTETLYHASVKARQLAQSGFSLTMPKDTSSAGLGGSQSAGGGKKGISFTEDEYVAKEIARVFREVAMVARGDVTPSDIADWARRQGKLDKVVEWFNRNYLPSGLRYKYVITGDPKGLHVTEFDPKLDTQVPVPYNRVFSGPEEAMGLYLSYLLHSGRYDPKFFGIGPKSLVQNFSRLNPRDIGYVKATVDMTNPFITYGGGEREYRVPPDAVVSVDRFVG